MSNVWTYRLTDCPGLDDYEQTGNADEPGQVLMIERRAQPGVVDLCILQHYNAPHTAVYAWETAGSPEEVIAELKRSLPNL